MKPYSKNKLLGQFYSRMDNLQKKFSSSRLQYIEPGNG